MKNNENKDAAPDTVSAADQQNRGGSSMASANGQ